MKLPDGYDIEVLTRGQFSDYTVSLMFGGTVVGTVYCYDTTVRCATRKIRVYETHSRLEPEHRGKGLGLAMYSAAIDYGLERGDAVVSTYSPSAFAQRVWCSTRLAKAYLVSKLNKRYWVSRARKVEE